jgi:hypothetical protein
MRRGASVERRAERLVRWYPPEWRTRYGAEFVELLVDDLHDRPRALGRDLDVVLHGLWTRLACGRTVGDVVGAQRRRRVALSVLAAVAVLFILLGSGVWSQMMVGWAWSAPADPATRSAMWLMSAALLGLAIVLASAIVLLVGGAARRVARGDAPGMWRPAMAMVVAAAGLYVGCHHFGAGWPGTGGHSGSGRGLVPESVTRLAWAGTLWITSYWAHPAALGSFPAGEVAWMVLSPAAWLVLFAAGLRLFRRVGLGPRLQRWMVGAAAAVVGLMVVFLAGAGTWVLASAPGPRNLFAVGAIDLVTVAVLTGALILATHMLWRAGRRPDPRAAV